MLRTSTWNVPIDGGRTVIWNVFTSPLNPSHASSAYSASRYEAVRGRQSTPGMLAPASRVTTPGRSPIEALATHWASPGLVRFGKPTAMRPSSLATPPLRTLAVSVNDCPR